jgi:hypothetical protein
MGSQKEKEQFSLGLQDAGKRLELDRLFDDWKEELKQAGWAKTRKGEMVFGTLSVTFKAITHWMNGPLGLKDWPLLKAEARRELKEQRLKANINKINEEALALLLQRLDPYVQEILNDGEFKKNIDRIVEKNLVRPPP